MVFKIYKNGEEINTIVADANFVTSYCEKHGYTFEEVTAKPAPEPETELTMWDELDAAYREGVDSV